MKFKRAGFLTKIVVLVLLIFLTTAFLELRSQIRSAEATRASLSQDVADMELKNQELAEAVENSDDPEMMEKVAREHGYAKKDEIIIYDVAN